VELYEQIRREYEHGPGTIRAVSRKLGVHRREVRRALESAIPAERKVPEREHPKLAPAIPFINADPGVRPQGAQKTAAYRAPDLDADAARDARGRSFRIDDSPVCPFAQGGHGPAWARDLCAAVLSVPAAKRRWIGMKAWCCSMASHAR